MKGPVITKIRAIEAKYLIKNIAYIIARTTETEFESSKRFRKFLLRTPSPGYRAPSHRALRPQ